MYELGQPGLLSHHEHPLGRNSRVLNPFVRMNDVRVCLFAPTCLPCYDAGVPLENASSKKKPLFCKGRSRGVRGKQKPYVNDNAYESGARFFPSTVVKDDGW